MRHPIPAAALERHIGILGKTGSGKSNTAKVLAEGIMADGGRVCVIDPTGTWWGIRLAPDGKKQSAFKPVIFGGNHADIQIAAEHGAAVGEAIATASSSAIIDTRVMTVGARTRFFTAFGEALLRANRGPLHLIIDEAHLFMPQGKVNDPQSGAMLHAANNLVSLGRGLGLRIILISQRPAKIHKDSLSQVETLVAMRLIAPQDRKAIDDWIGEWADPGKGKEITTSLPSLPTGTAWVWSPEIDVLERVKFPLAATFDSGKPLSLGEAAPELTPINIEEIGTKLDSIRQEAQQNDPARLKRTIADLQKQVASNQAAKINTPDPAAIEEAERRGYERARAVMAKRMTAFGKTYDGAIEAVRTLLWPAFEEQFRLPSIDAGSPSGKATGFGPVTAGSSPALATTSPARPLKRPDTTAPKTEVSDASGQLTGPQSAVLGALSWWRAMNFDQPTRAQVAAKVGWKVNGSNLRNRLADLSSKGLIEYPAKGTVRMTAAGIDVAPAPELGTSLIDSIKAHLTGPQNTVFDVLIAAEGPLSRMDLGAAVGWEPTGSNLRNRLADLSTLELIHYPGKGLVELQEWVR